TTRGRLAGASYLEAGSVIDDRFAVRLDLPEAEVPYLLEIAYPDDKKRTMEILAQSSADASTEYMMQGGVMLGDEYPNSGEMRTFQCILCARSRDTTLIFMTAREGAPAAVSKIRVSRIEGGLPAADIHPAPPVAGWNRTVALYYEDPALPLSFGKANGLMPDFQDTVHRLAAYMAWSGQNMLLYPVVWYQGLIGSGYNPRGHAPEFIRVILSEFGKRGLSFMGTINLHSIPLPDGVVISAETVADGSLHDTPVMIMKTGKPNPGGWHGTSPRFNPLHPATQAFVTEQVDRVLDAAADSPAFKGLVLHLTRHTTPWFGHIESGYNDYNIDWFEKETQIQVPVSRVDPERGRLYYDWLMENAREEWIAWRCRKLAEFYRGLADRISARRPDLKLGIFSYSPTVSELSDPRYREPG
ncbi:MAG: hypothetical protein U1E27_08145, partial [Kiritimatiellia bacterium]|nr:hypothetical protein [Kiritimatiellia bacterium]